MTRDREPVDELVAQLLDLGHEREMDLETLPPLAVAWRDFTASLQATATGDVHLECFMALHDCNETEARAARAWGSR